VAQAKTRAEIVLSIVVTDNTFLRSKPRFYSEERPLDVVWVGRCIHCNTQLVVSIDGKTGATIEHIQPLCDGGHPTDPRNLALACARCNNEKGIRHDIHVGKGGRADEVVLALQEKRSARWRSGTEL
jgi:5-methylcytosine-specific restriction endonuclease McrA